MATAREVKRFVTAFKRRMSQYSRCVKENGVRKHRVVNDVEACYVLLNTAYGGVGMDVLGTQRVCVTGSH